MKSSPIDKKDKVARFFNMFGDLIENKIELKQLEQVGFRPRPTTILRKDQLTRLKKDNVYKKKYEELFK